ncbi:MAG: helix-turn-helix domain-containing protein [Candidatus Acidiferrales bacterium]
MLIGQRLRELRESKKLSQGDIEKRTGLLRCYVSRVENGHTTPNVETLEKYARAMEIPLYRLFYDGETPPTLALPLNKPADWGTSDGQVSEMRRLTKFLGRMSKQDQRLLLKTAQVFAKRETAQLT